MKICSIDDCNKKILAKGFCRSHYRKTSDKLCSIKECNKVHEAKGFCTNHYRAFKKYGDASYVDILKCNQITICSIEECNIKIKAKGFCNIHYKSFKKYGHPLVSSVKYESCSIADCLRPVNCKGLCHKHYVRFKNGLNLTDKTIIEMNAEERIKKNIIINPETNCWDWTGSKACHGYGAVTYNHKSFRTHRWSYKTFKGDIPDNLCVLHKCDRPICINPDHLFLGTQKENMQDMVAKGRSGLKGKRKEVQL